MEGSRARARAKSLLFSAGWFYFHQTLYTSRRGAPEIKRDEVEQYSSRPAREKRREGESRRAA